MTSFPSGIGVVTALVPEARCLLGRWPAGGDPAAAGLVRVCGVGCGRAAEAARALCARGATALLSWGTAAALDPALRPGALMVPKAVVGLDGRRHPVDVRWREEVVMRLEEPVRVHGGLLAASTEVLRTPREKAELHRASGAIAADMESAGVAEVAAEAGVPWLAIRAVVDRADVTVPASVLVAVDADGRLAPRRLAAVLIRRPAEMAALARLGVAFARARGTLRRTARLGGEAVFSTASGQGAEPAR